jgi:hypothetical protein
VDQSWECKIAHRHMNVEIGTEAAQFPEKEYINGIFVAVWSFVRLSVSGCRRTYWHRTVSTGQCGHVVTLGENDHRGTESRAHRVKPVPRNINSVDRLL